MKLHSRLTIVLGGTALAAFALNFAISLIGIRGTENFAEAAVGDINSGYMKFASENAVSAEAVSLEKSIDSDFRLLEGVFSSTNPFDRGGKLFQTDLLPEIDYLFLVSGEKIALFRNPERKSLVPIMGEKEYPEFLRQIRRTMASKRFSAYAADKVPGVIWLVYSPRGSQDLAAFRINAKDLLEKLSAGQTDSATLLAWSNGDIAAVRNDDIPGEVAEKLPGEARKTGADPSKRLIDSTVLPVSGVPWTVSSANIRTLAENPIGLHLVKAVRTPESLASLATEISNSSSSSTLILLFALLFSLLIFIPVLIVVTRTVSELIESAAKYARDIFDADVRPENLHISYSDEFSDLSDTMNFLRDKLTSALARLSRSHDRELQARKEAEDSNFLRSGLLSEITAEIREPLSRIDGFAGVILRKSEPEGDIALAGAKIAADARKLASVLRSLSDLSALDSAGGDIAFFEIEPSDLLREASAALAAEANARGVSFEMHCNVHFQHPVMSSPSILTHILYTAANAVMRFAPDRTRIRIGCGIRNDMLVFECSGSAAPGKPSVAGVFREYTESGRITAPGCGAAILDLLILKTEAELLNADVRIDRTGEADTLIEIALPVRELNPAMTTRFKPVTGANPEPERTATAIKLNLPNISRNETPAAASSPAKSGGLPSEILFVNFSDDDAMLYRMMLDSEGCSIARASSGAECAELLPRRRFGVIVADMPRENAGEGCSMIAGIRKLAPQTPVLVLTTSGSTEDVGSFLSAGASLCLRKPVSMESFLAAVRKSVK